MLRSSFSILFISLFFIYSYSQESKMFWVSGNKIQSANLNGTNIVDIVTGLQMPAGIAVDCTSTPMKLYYSERGTSKIVRVNFDGSNPEEIITGEAGIKDIELDVYNRKIYWSKDTYSDDRIQRADMDSLNSNIEDLYTSGYAMHGFNGVAIDTINHWVFWTQSRYGSVDVLKRTTFSGTNDTIIGSYLNPKDIDVVGNRIYWVWYGYDMFMSAKKNGSDVDTILTNMNALYFDIDTTLGKVYWADNTYNKISCANLDGSGRIDLLTGIGSLSGIALYVNSLTMSVNDEEIISQEYALKQNYPNPFNPSTIIDFSIPKSEFVSLKIYNMLGQEVTTLVSDKLSAGRHTYSWNASEFSSGVYYYVFKVGSNQFAETKKLIYLK